MIYLNKATLTVIYELVSGSYLKLLCRQLVMVRFNLKRFSRELLMICMS